MNLRKQGTQEEKRIIDKLNISKLREMTFSLRKLLEANKRLVK